MRETQNYKLKKIDKEFDKVLASIDYLNSNFDKIDTELKSNKTLTENSTNENKNYIDEQIGNVNETITQKEETLNETINAKEAEINESVDSKIAKVNETIETKEETLNETINAKEKSINENITAQIAGVNEKINETNTNIENHIADEIKHITNEERNAWNAKSDFSGSYNDLTEIPETFTPAEHNHDESYYKKTEIDENLQNYYTKSEVDEKGFITSMVDNLSNYYKKEEVQNLVNAVKTGLFQTIETLPDAGEPYIIYLVPSTKQEDKNIKDEYIWVNDTWELIGSTKIDLSGYSTTEQMNEALAQKLNATDIAEWAKQKDKPSYSYSEIKDAPKPYELPVASAEDLGGVKVGAGLTITEGVLSATGGGTADAVEWENVQNKPQSFTPSAHTHEITDIKDLKIPAKTSELENDSGFLTEQDISGKADKTALDAYVRKAGDLMKGSLNMGSYKLTNLGTPTNTTDGATKKYVDDTVASKTVDLSAYQKKTDNIVASRIIAGTLAGKVGANSSAVSTLETAQVRNVKAGTTDLTDGSSELATGDIYIYYEA